jgi:hypothetical protein
MSPHLRNSIKDCSLRKSDTRPLVATVAIRALQSQGQVSPTPGRSAHDLHHLKADDAHETFACVCSPSAVAIVAAIDSSAHWRVVSSLLDRSRRIQSGRRTSTARTRSDSSLLIRRPVALRQKLGNLHAGGRRVQAPQCSRLATRRLHGRRHAEAYAMLRDSG